MPCPFCGMDDDSSTHRAECLERHHDTVKGRSLADTKADGMVRIETWGSMLVLPRLGVQAVMEIPVNMINGTGLVTKEEREGALGKAVKDRLWHFLEEDVQAGAYVFRFTLDRTNAKIHNGINLKAGDLVRTGVARRDGSWVDEAPANGPQPTAPQGTVKIMPTARILIDDALYSNRPFDSLAYILSEFIDNSLQVHLRAVHPPHTQARPGPPYLAMSLALYTHALAARRACPTQAVLMGWKKRLKDALESGDAARIRKAKTKRPWIRLSVLVDDEGGDIAFCIQDDGHGIKHNRLASALRQKDPDPLLKDKKLREEHLCDLYLDALISEYGVGVKQAGFYLGKGAHAISPALPHLRSPTPPRPRRRGRPRPARR